MSDRELRQENEFRTDRTGGAMARGEALWRSNGARTEKIEVWLSAEGDLTLRHHQTGSQPLDGWGRDDYEATLEIAREDVGRLTLALLKAGFFGRRDALKQLRAFCKHEGVAHRIAVWT
jgi:hypothetical protein